MKRYKWFLFVLIFVLIMPIFAFACDEKTIDDVPYVSSSKTSQEIYNKINSTKTQMIDDNIKMDLSSQVIFNFYETQHFEIESKKITNETSVILAKNTDNPMVSAFFSKNYLNDVLKNSEQKTYIKQTSSNDQSTTTFSYTLNKGYNNGKEDEVISTQYLREKYSNSTIVTLSHLYNNVVPDINFNFFDVVLEKTYENTTYYKLTADINGLENINDFFEIQNDFSSSPEIFYKNSYLDYVNNFNCEYGLIETAEATYLTSFALNYSIINVNREKYLDVSISVSLNKYGNSVQTINLEDTGEYTANTFIDTMKQDNSYCVYNKVENGNIDNVTYSVVQIKKSTQDNENKTINYFDYSVKEVGNETNYYYLKGQLNSTTNKIEYTVYKLLSNNTMQVISDFDFKWLQFDFNLQYSDKKLEALDTYYQFGTGETYIKVRLNDVEDVSTIEKNKKEGLLESNLVKLKIQSYGSNNKIGLVTSLDGYTIAN